MALMHLLLLLAFVVTIWYRSVHRKFYKLYEKLPKAHGNFPLIGVAWRFYKSLNPSNIYESVSTILAPGPSPRRFNVGPACFVIVDDPEQVQKVLLSRISINKILYAKSISEMESSEFFERILSSP
jgi:hypothetical protein